MSREDVTAILIYGGGGALSGVVFAFLFCRHRNPLIATTIASLIGAPLIALSFVAIAGAAESTRRFGFNPARAIAAALSTVFFLVFGLPVVCGVPATIAGFTTQCLLQRLLGSQDEIDIE
jgi:hypothetical protein